MVAAIGENNVIGRDGQLPWRAESGPILEHFRALTMGKPVIMGRKTYESIGKPLEGRTNIVMTHKFEVKVPGGALATSLDAALAFAREDCRKRGIDQIMVIGGSDVFADPCQSRTGLRLPMSMPRRRETLYFPPIDPDVWREVARREYPAGPDDSASFALATYLRR